MGYNAYSPCCVTIFVVCCPTPSRNGVWRMIDIDLLSEKLENRQFREIRQLLSEENPVDAAACIESLEVEKGVLVFRILQKDFAVDVFANLFSDMQQAIIEVLSDREITHIIEELYVDDAVGFLEEMPAGIVKKVLAHAKEDTRAQINTLLHFPENSAGGIMTVEFVDLKGEMTVAAAFERIRKTGMDKETIYTCYVIDERRSLVGTVSVRKLLLSGYEEKINSIMDTNIIFAKTLDDQEQVAHQFEKYDLLSVPVVDSENRLVGIITVDDIIDIVQQEATEDFEKMAAILPSEKPYLKTGTFTLVKNRLPWLLILMFSAMITGGILGIFEDAIAAIPLLVTFIPMLTATGGNAGSQSSTMVIRGMALREVSLKDSLKVLWREVKASLLIGLILSALNYIRVMIQYPGREPVAITVAISLLFVVVLSQALGGLLPLLAKFFKLDPAVMAAPLITTIVDAFCLIIFFSIAKVMLQF